MGSAPVPYVRLGEFIASVEDADNELGVLPHLTDQREG